MRKRDDFSKIALPDYIEWVRKFFIGKEKCRINGKGIFDYFLLSKNVIGYISRRWDAQLDYIIGNPPNTELFYISENVPNRFRKYMMYHEYYEYKILAPDTSDRCLDALKKELSMIPNKIYISYVRFRAAQFANLADFNRKIGADECFVLNLEKSVQFLEKELTRII